MRKTIFEGYINDERYTDISAFYKRLGMLNPEDIHSFSSSFEEVDEDVENETTEASIETKEEKPEEKLVNTNRFVAPECPVFNPNTCDVTTISTLCRHYLDNLDQAIKNAPDDRQGLAVYRRNILSEVLQNISNYQQMNDRASESVKKRIDTYDQTLCDLQQQINTLIEKRKTITQEKKKDVAKLNVSDNVSECLNIYKHVIEHANSIVYQAFLNSYSPTAVCPSTEIKTERPSCDSSIINSGDPLYKLFDDLFGFGSILCK